MIELFPHNERAYKKLVNSLKTQSLAFIEHATGTGKSFIMLKYLYEIMRENRILIVSMHYEMFDQLLGSQMRTLGITKDDFKKLNTMIYHNIIKTDPKKLIQDYDCFIFDEAHHCGAKKWSKVIRELKELVKTTPNKKMIGFTATGTRYLDDYLDVSNEFFDGNTVSRLSVAEAILENLLPAPLYINSTIKCVDKIDYLLKILNKAPRNEEVVSFQNTLLNLRKKVIDSGDVPNLVKKYDIKPGEKYIVFCSSIDDLKEKMREAKTWFPYEVKMYEAHSRQSRDKNKEAIQSFSENKEDTCLMFAVDIFNEGFHIDDVDGIFMFRHTTSPIVYLQQIGRALSFSLRKKQIKIFDMVDNISDNDVILELYKEIIEESKRLIKENSDKKSFYQEILSRFQIIDNTNQVMDELNNIEEIVKTKYFIRNQVDQAILKLMEYRYMYPTGNVLKDLYTRANKIYLSSYRIILNNKDYLTDEQVVKLANLNIPFNGICLDVEVRRRELGEFKNYKELEVGKLKEFIDSYVSFIKEHGFRPRHNSLDDNEYALYMKYREFLSTAKKKNIYKLINANQDPSTVEELVLIGSIPSYEKIKEYLSQIRYKLVNNIILDAVEAKVFSRLRKAIWIDDEVLLAYFERQQDFSKKMDDRIKIIEDYLSLYPGEKFVDIRDFYHNTKLFNALKFIHKHALRITNYQFKKLLDLGINLPDSINMTWEERCELLGDNDSFYEKEQVLKNGFINRYTKFVKTYSLRPSLNGDKEEQELALLYNEKLFDINATKLRELANVLEVNNIPLTSYEKLILGKKQEVDELTKIYNEILTKISKDDISSRDLKILNRLINDRNFLYVEEARVFIASLRFAQSFNSSLYKLNTDEANKFLNSVYANYKHLSPSMLDTLISHGVNVPVDIIVSIKSLKGYRTLNEEEKIKTIRGKYQYIEYVKKNKKRPVDKNVNQLYRDYLATLYHDRLNLVLNEVQASVGSLTTEEELLLGNIPSDVNKVITHLKSADHLDSLDYRLYKILLGNKLIDNIYSQSRTYDERIFTHSVERNMYMRVREEILKNPICEICYYPEYHYLTKSEINRLNNYRVRVLADTYLRIIYDKISKNKVTLENGLTKEELMIFKFLAECDNLDNVYRDLIVKITNLSYKNSFLEKSVDYKGFLDEYISFIVNHHGIRPRITSDDEREAKLAESYEKCFNLFDIADIKRIDDAISVTISKDQEANFFDNFVEFVRINNRFPCNNALDEQEIMLASTFMNVSKKLTKDQTKYITMLRKKVAANTIKMTKEFEKMRKEKSL